MKRSFVRCLAGSLLLFGAVSCNSGGDTVSPSIPAEVKSADAPLKGQSAVSDDVSQKDVVKIAAGSPDHTTLVKALQAAEYVDVLSNAGPFTVFAPTNAAFDKLPKGTLEELLKPEKKGDLRSILEYHVFVGVLNPNLLQDGMTYGMASGDNIKVTVKDGKTQVNGVTLGEPIKASNGIIYIIDQVLLAPKK
jgi:uncharacterized surface protein with fasciclin (FAS1) repeats